jgi:hypothetical protein
MSNEFKNPYLGEDVTAINFDIGRNDYNFIKSIRPTGGTVTITASILWKALADELKRKGITSWENGGLERFEALVANCRVVDAGVYEDLVLVATKAAEQDPIGVAKSITGRGLPNGPSGGTVQQATTPDDGARTPGVRPGSETNANVVPDVQSKGRRKGKGKSAGKE